MRCAAVLLALLGCAARAVADETADGFVPLFNGKDLSGWQVHDGKPESWTAADGLLVCTGAKGGGWLGPRAHGIAGRGESWSVRAPSRPPH